MRVGINFVNLFGHKRVGVCDRGNSCLLASNRTSLESRQLSQTFIYLFIYLFFARHSRIEKRDVGQTFFWKVLACESTRLPRFWSLLTSMCQHKIAGSRATEGS